MKFLNQKSSGGESSSSLLLDPNSSLNQIVPSSVIAKANKIVAPVLPSAANHVERGPYTKFTPAQRYEISKRAAEYGVALSICYSKGKYQHLVLKETTVCRLKNLHTSELQKAPLHSRLQTSQAIQELVPKKRGKPLIIGEHLDKQVREYLLEIRG